MLGIIKPRKNKAKVAFMKYRKDSTTNFFEESWAWFLGSSS
jgi:hypothetical protein